MVIEEFSVHSVHMQSTIIPYVLKHALGTYSSSGTIISPNHQLTDQP